MAIQIQRYILAHTFRGLPRREDFVISETTVTQLKEGQFLAEAVYISLDPSVIAYANKLRVGAEITVSEQVAKVIESKTKKFPVGTYVIGCFGWCTYTIADENFKGLLGQTKPSILPDVLYFTNEYPLSFALGVLGTPGFAAYFGLLEICKPKFGETVVVTAAAGAVGSIVGQIAKIKGCTVIGIAGRPEKEVFLKECGFDKFIDYADPNFAKILEEAAPKGIDCFFDNVGGEISSIIINHMNTSGRIAVCGSTSSYSATANNIPRAPILQPALVFKELKIQGFLVYRWSDRYMEALTQNQMWFKQGVLKYKETVTEGFENLFDAFIAMLHGGNLGKAILKV